MSNVFVNGRKSMKSLLLPVCESLAGNKSNEAATNTIISQFISTFDLDTRSIQALTHDPMLTTFVQYLAETLYTTSIPKPSDGPVPDVVTEILKFLNSLLVVNPTLLDSIAVSANLDLLIPQFFSSNISNDEIIEIQASHLFLPVKFIALVSSSRQVQLTTTTASNLMVAVIGSLLNSPQLAAWASASAAGLSRHCKAFHTVIRVHPMAKAIKTKLAALLPSSDPLVVIGALAATVTLFHIGESIETAAAAALQYIVEESEFPLTAQLCSWVIIELAKKVELSEADLSQILNVPAHSQGMRAFTVYSLAAQLMDMKYRFGTHEQIQSIAASLIDCNDSNVAVAGCQFLFTVAETNPSLLMGLDEDGRLLYHAIQVFETVAGKDDIEMMESILILMKILIDKGEVSKPLAKAIACQEELFFMSFLRNIEANNAYLAVAFFSFLMACARHIPKWVMRMKRLLVESEFPALLVHVLTSSKNRRAISDALRALQFYLNDFDVTSQKTSYFFDSAVSGFLVVNHNQVKGVEHSKAQMEQERHNAAIVIHTLEAEKKQLMKDNAKLKEELNRQRNETQITNDSHSRSLEELEKRTQEVATLKRENQALLAEINDNKDHWANAAESLRQCQEENEKLARLVKRLEEYKLESRALHKATRQMEVHVHEVETDFTELKAKHKELHTLTKALNKELHSRDEQFNSIQKACAEAQQRNHTLQSLLDQTRTENQSLTDENSSLQAKLSSSLAKNSRLSELVTSLEAENLQVKASLRSADEIEATYKEKRAVLRSKIQALEKEKRKWETVARFTHHVGEVKGTTVQHVFGPIPPNK